MTGYSDRRTFQAKPLTFDSGQRDAFNEGTLGKEEEQQNGHGNDRADCHQVRICVGLRASRTDRDPELIDA